MIPILAIAIVAVGLVVLVKVRGGEQLCGHRPLPADAVPIPARFTALTNTSVPPAGCGAVYHRRAALSGPGSNEEATLAAYGRALRREGWRPTACVTSHERCFRRAKRFLAAVPAHTRPLPSGYAPAGARARILVVVQS